MRRNRYVCPRGHRHDAGSAYCSVCGAGPVLPVEGARFLRDMDRLISRAVQRRLHGS